MGTICEFCNPEGFVSLEVIQAAGFQAGLTIEVDDAARKIRARANISNNNKAGIQPPAGRRRPHRPQVSGCGCIHKSEFEHMFPICEKTVAGMNPPEAKHERRQRGLPTVWSLSGETDTEIRKSQNPINQIID